MSPLSPDEVEALFRYIAHGDEEHRRWLRYELYRYFGYPAPREG